MALQYFCGVLFGLVLLQYGSAKYISKEDIDSRFIKIGSFPAHSGNREKRSTDRGAQNVYYISRNQAAWGDAWFECRQGMNGELLSVETIAEDQFIRDFLIKHGIDNVWTSGAYDTNLGIWRWLSNTGEATYLNWLPGQPAGSDSTQRIIFQNSLFSYGWQTVDITTQNFYICEQTGDPVPQPTPSTVAPPTTPPTEATTTIGTPPPSPPTADTTVATPPL